MMPVSNNVTEHAFQVSRLNREEQLNQKAKVIWIFGLSGSGKSTLADSLSSQLFKKGYHSTILDGDNTRLGLNKDLGFSEEDRNENIRRVAEVSKLLVDTGLIVICCFITPLQRQRKIIEQIIGSNDLAFIYIDSSLEVCEARDKKGLYKRARSGEITEFTGVSAPFEIPENPFLSISNDSQNIEEACEKLMSAVSPLICYKK